MPLDALDVDRSWAWICPVRCAQTEVCEHFVATRLTVQAFLGVNDPSRKGEELSNPFADLVYGLVLGGNGPGSDAARLIRAYRRASTATAAGAPRTDQVLRDALVHESVAGAYDDPDAGRVAHAYSAWREGATFKEFRRRVRQANRLRLRRR